MVAFRALYLITFTVAFLHVTQCTHKQNICPTQRSMIRVQGKIHIIVWKSKSDSQYSVVLSDPPCLDENKNLVARVCLNSVWTTPKDVCRYVEENTACPQEFIQDEKWCIHTTEPQKSDSNCPYYGTSFKVKENPGSVWLPIKRKVRYGPLEYTLPGEKYGLEFYDEHSPEITERYLDTDCVIGTTTKLSPCDSLHPHVCSYKYNHFLFHCPKDCVVGGLGSSYCFCKVQDGNRKGLPQNKWCKRLAAPRYSYERSILQKLVKDDICWVRSLQKNSNFSPNHFGRHFYIAVNKHEWSLHKDGEINCAVCEVDAVSYQRVDLLLKFNPKSHKLYLDLYSPESVFKDEDEDMVYCFTDATDKLKKRVEIKERWDSDSEPKSSRRLKVFQVSLEKDGPGNYWCEAFQLPEVSLVKSNTVVAYKELKGHEYSLRIVIYNFCRFSATECKNPSISFISRLSKNLFDNRFFVKFVKNVRLFHIYNINTVNERLDILLHLTTQAKMPLVAEYFALNRNLQWLRLQKINIVFFRSSEACLPENTFSGDVVLKWKLSSIGTIRTPEEICITKNGMPVRRKCEGDFLFGSQWSKVQGNCSQNVSLSAKTELLHSLALSDASSHLTKNISAVTENCTDLTVLDLHYLAEVLSKVSGQNQSSPKEFIIEISQIIDNLMSANTTTMKLSQVLLNATDEILDTFENTLTTTNSSEDLFLLKKSNLIIQVTKPFLNNISGLILLGDDESSFANSEVVHLYTNTTFEDLVEDDLEVAAYVPEKLLNILSENLTLDSQVNMVVITIVYFSDNFFNSNNDTNTANAVGSKVVSISIPGFDEILQSAIPIVFKSQTHRNNQECAFWNYGLASETRSGYWSTLGGNYLGQLNNSYSEICSFTHLTNFALLVKTGDLSVPDDENISYNLTADGHDKAFTIISNVGCSLSLLGLFGIFTTSIIFQSWREKVGTKILIQLCITIFLQIIFLNVADVNKSTKVVSASFCTAVGIILHYVIISEFCWMLVAAILQFFRFVKVVGPLPNRIILKATIIGWLLPTLPIIIVCAVDYQSYSAGIQGLCYPKGTSLYLGVLFPIALIVIANLAVFIAVIRNVFVLSVEARSNSQKILKRQIFLAILLFFLLGLPWIFGLLGEIVNRDSILSYIFIYMFCLTASLQGFVLFVFYVVLDKSTRTLWYTLFKRTLNRNLC